MKNNEKTRKKGKVQFKFGTSEIIIFAIIFLLLGVIVVTLVSDKSSLDNDDNEDNNENVVEVANNNPGVVEDKEQDGLSFTNTMLLTSDGKSTLTTLVSNLTESDIDVRIFEIYVKDKTGNLMVTLPGYVGEVVPVGESREIVSYVDMNLKDAFNIEYKLVK